MANILVVDDDDQLRKLIRRLLQQAGHSVVEAADGLAALRLLQESAVDLVVSDVVMPDMDGLELIRRAKKDHPGLRILAVSGAGQEGPGLYLELAGRFGADAVLLKPFESARLVEEIARLLGK